MIKLFDHRFDEFAGATHENLAPRTAVAMGAAALALLALPWPACATWAGVILCIEVWGWFASRRQHIGQPVDRAGQVNFLVNVSFLIACWFAMGLMLWATGRMDGAVAATIIWISIIGFAQTFGSRSPLGFGVCGVAPAAGVLAVVMTDGRLDVAQRGLIFGIMALAVGFAICGARQTFAAGRRLEAALKALGASEAQYRTLADSMSDVVGCVDLVKGGWRYVSPSVEAALGYTPQEFMGLDGEDYVHADDLSGLRLEFDALPKTGGPATVQYRQIRKDGSVIWVETSFNLVRDPATGEPMEVVAELRDVSFRKAMERELVEARERALAAAAAKADFLANMTHELRTPLNAIIGFSGVLRGSNDLTERDGRHARLINDASATLLVVVNDILDFSKLESGAFELDPQPFDPLALARSAAMLVEDQAIARGLTLDVRSAGETGALSGDGPRLQQVLLNLLSNALKFTTVGSVTLLVQQTPLAQAGQRRLRVTVTDTGIGIGADKLETVFERFNQADASVSRRFGGTGLGLAICKRIIGLMGGRIGLTSREGEGSTFWFELDLAEAAPQDETGAAAEPTALERPLRLLLVEDVDVNRELVKVMLEAFDIEIDTAENGVEAIEAVARAPYDLVLMDVQMPVMDGLTAAARIRALAGPAARLPIVAMTANVLPEQIKRCLEAGMDGHVGKPISPGALLEAIARWTAPDATADTRERAAG